MERYTWWQVLLAWLVGVILGAAAMAIAWSWSAWESRPDAGLKQAEEFVALVQGG